MDRDYAGQFGLTMADVSTSLVPATGSSRFIAPNYWRDPRTGNAFQIQVQLPPNRMQGLGALSALPVMRDGQSQPLLGQVAKLQYGTMPETIERFSGQRIVSVTANLHGIRWARHKQQIEAALKQIAPPGKGSTVVVRGQIPALEETTSGLRTGLLLAIAAIFLLLMAYFQSLRLPLAILSTIPGVLSGVVLMLLFTGTTLNIQSFMGAIMAVGISVANSILLVSFAEQARREPQDVETATRDRSNRPCTRHPDDGDGHDLRHDPAGDRLRRGRRPIRTPGPRGDRGSHLLHADYTAGASRVLRALAKEGERHVELSQP